jgi:predicted membrane protein DUF2254
MVGAACELAYISLAACGFCSAARGAMINMATIAISITMVVLALAAQQLGPRLIRSFMSDWKTQVSLGIFVATVVYLILVLRSLREDGFEFCGDRRDAAGAHLGDHTAALPAPPRQVDRFRQHHRAGRRPDASFNQIRQSAARQTGDPHPHGGCDRTIAAAGVLLEVRRREIPAAGDLRDLEDHASVALEPELN